MLCVIYLTRDSTAQCVCSPGAGFNPPEFLSPCGLPVSCCLATSVVRSRNSKRLVAPPRVYVCICMDSAGPAWSSLAQDLCGSGRHERSICTSPSPGPWRSRRLASVAFAREMPVCSTKSTWNIYFQKPSLSCFNSTFCDVLPELVIDSVWARKKSFLSYFCFSRPFLTQMGP